MATAADFARAFDGAQATQLELRCQRTADGQAIVSMRGELDIATARQAHAYLLAVIDGEKKGRVTLNLADLTFCDAAGLGVLAKVAGHARRTGRSVRLAAPRPALVRIMCITGMDEAFPEIRTPVLTMVPGPRQPGSRQSGQRQPGPRQPGPRQSGQRQPGSHQPGPARTRPPRQHPEQAQ